MGNVFVDITMSLDGFVTAPDNRAGHGLGDGGECLVESPFATHIPPAAEAAGHDPGSLPVAVQVNGPVTTEPLAERAPLTGSVEQVAEDLAELRSLGADQVFWSMVGTEPDAQLRALELLLAQEER